MKVSKIIHYTIVALLSVTLCKELVGVTPLDNAIFEENVRKVAQLIQEGANVNAPDKSEVTPLLRAVGVGNAKIVAQLIQAGADVNKAGGQGLFKETPLHKAAKNGKTEIVAQLLEAEANVNAPDILGRTPLYWAAQGKNVGIAELLLSHDAEEKGLTPNQLSWLGDIKREMQKKKEQTEKALLEIEVAPELPEDLAQLTAELTH